MKKIHLAVLCLLLIISFVSISLADKDVESDNKRLDLVISGNCVYLPAKILLLNSSKYINLYLKDGTKIMINNYQWFKVTPEKRREICDELKAKNYILFE